MSAETEEQADHDYPRHEFSTSNELHLFSFTEIDDLECPDCSEHFSPANLGDAVDWALGHKCDAPWESSP